MINVTIDGKTIQVPEGTTVLRAAEAAGITIPTLCDHKELTPYGGCRLCVVEVEGARTLQPSCTLPVTNNMVVHTDTEKTRNARKFILTLIFSERNHFCMYCQVSNGDCELQNSAYREGMTHWPLSPNYQPFAVDASHPFFVLDNNRCILCRRCVRACGELVGNYTLGFEERGARSYLVADLGTPLGQSTCISCGVCVQICPTGALIDRQSAYRGKETQVEHHQTVCTGCSVGCEVDVLTRDNNLVRLEGIWGSPISGGLLCKLGHFIPLEERRDRLTTPLVRKDGALKAATWDEALAVVASHLKPLSGKNGSGIAAMVSAGLPVEAISTFKQVFSDGLKSGLVTTTEEGRSTAAASAVADEIGKPFEGSLQALHQSDCFVVANTDLVTEHEVAGFFVKRSLPMGANLVTIDGAANGLDGQADYALKAKKGAEADLFFAIAAVILKSGKAKGQPAADLGKYSPETASAKCGVPAQTITAVANLIAKAEKPAFIYGAVTAAGLVALVELARVTGAFSDTLSSLIGIKGKANSTAAAYFGLEKPFELKDQKAVYLALGDEAPSQSLIKRVEKAPFLVVQASYASPLTARADVVLPVENWCEQDGHLINLEGKIQSLVRAITPPEEIRSSEAVMEDLGSRMGVAVYRDWKAHFARSVSMVALS